MALLPTAAALGSSLAIAKRAGLGQKALDRVKDVVGNVKEALTTEAVTQVQKKSDKKGKKDKATEPLRGSEQVKSVAIGIPNRQGGVTQSSLRMNIGPILEPIQDRIQAVIEVNTQQDQELEEAKGAIKELEARLVILEAIIEEQGQKGERRYAMLSTPLMAMAKLGVKVINIGDTIQNATAATIAAALDELPKAWEMEKDEAAMLEGLAGLAWALAYYDASVGFSSLISRDATTTTTTTSTSIDTSGA